MPITDTLILPPDVLLVPVKDLPESMRQQVKAEEGDYALTRPRSRTPSRIVDEHAAGLLKHFRKPLTIAQAVIHFSRETESDPEETLVAAYPLLERLAHSRLLVPADSEEAKQIQTSLQTGDTFAGSEIIRCVQSVEDSELYQARTTDGKIAALKILRANAAPAFSNMFDREADILERLKGSVSPQLLQSGSEDGRRYLLIEWCTGFDCASAAAEIRRSGGASAKSRLVKLAGAILHAYAHLHEQHVIHSDIHPNNVLVDDSNSVKIIDFGVARVTGIESEFRRAQRAGVAFFYEPEYANAVRNGKGHIHSTTQGEQYALAALIYLLITGNHYLDFSLEKQEMLRQIAEDSPLEFSRRDLQPWPEMEQVLGRALSKDPSDRFSSVAEFATRLSAIAVEEPINVPAIAVTTSPAAYPDAERILQRVVARLQASEPQFRDGLSAAPKVSVNYGSAGAAFGLYRIACMREDPQLLALADLWATRAARDINRTDAFYCEEIEIRKEIVGTISPYHSPSGIHVVQALIAQAMGDVASKQLALENFMATAGGSPCDNLDVTLGRSGPILAASWLLRACPPDAYFNPQPLIDFGARALDQLWDEIGHFAPITECHEIQYSGIAHGWAGLLYTSLNWSRAAGTPLPPGVEERLEQLANLADQSGPRARWKWSTQRRRQHPAGDYMPGWCNGSAGFVFLWTIADQMLQRPDYGALAEMAAFDTWESEASIGNLCCGYSGMAYALLNLHRHTSDPAWLHRAQALTQRAARSIFEMTASGNFPELIDRPDSLYKGEMGIAVLASELERPEFAAMPFFEPPS